MLYCIKVLRRQTENWMFYETAKAAKIDKLQNYSAFRKSPENCENRLVFSRFNDTWRFRAIQNTSILRSHFEQQTVIIIFDSNRLNGHVSGGLTRQRRGICTPLKFLTSTISSF